MVMRDLKSVIYTSDDGRQYATKIDQSVFAQEDTPGTPDVGGADYAASPALPPLPRNYVPRHAKVSAVGHGKRRVVCLTATAPLYTGVVSTIDLPVLGAAAVTFTVYGTTAERGTIDHDPAQ